MSDSGFATASAVEEKMAGIVTSPDSATGGALPDDPRAVAAASAAVDARPDDSLSDGPATDPAVAPDRPAAPQSDPEWEAALARARWIARLGRRRRRPDGTREDWLEPAQRAELERRGRVRLAFYKAADAFAAREGRAPDKPEQRRLLAQVFTEEDAPRGWEMVADAFARSDPEPMRTNFHRVATGNQGGPIDSPYSNLRITDSDDQHQLSILASADGEERDPFLQSRRARQQEIEQEKAWRNRTGQDPDKFLPASTRRREMHELDKRLEEGRAAGLTPNQVADSLTDPAKVASYAVTLSGRELGPDLTVFLQALLTGRTARSFLENEARRMAEQVRIAFDKLPSDIWKQLKTSCPNLSPTERHAAVRRVTTQVAQELGVRGSTLRANSDYNHDSGRALAFILSNIDVNRRQSHIKNAAVGTNNVFLGHPDVVSLYPVEIMMLVVAEEAVHLVQRQARAEFEQREMPTNSVEQTRLSLLSANAANYYRYAGDSDGHNPDMFRRYILQPMEFEAKVVQHVLASRGYAIPEEVGRILHDNNRLFD